MHTFIEVCEHVHILLSPVRIPLNSHQWGATILSKHTVQQANVPASLAQSSLAMP